MSNFNSSSSSSSNSCRRNTKWSMRDSWLLRTIRVGSVLILAMFAWSSAGDMAAATVEMDASGTTFVQRVDTMASSRNIMQQQDHQNRQMSITDHPEAKYQLQQQQQQQRQVIAPTTTDDECGLYLAPSTIPGAGLGMFTVKPRSKGEYVGNAEVVLPLVELPFYNGGGDDIFNPLIHYYWKGKEKALHGIVAEERAGQVLALVPGMEAAINCNLALLNVDMAGSEYDDGNLQRHKDPMAGGMSPYHSTSSHVKRNIPEGGELFKFYGDRWFAARQESFGLIPLSADYPAAQRIVNIYDELQSKLFPDNRELQDDLWSLMKDTIGKEMWESRIMNALPADVTDAKKAADSDIASLHQPHAIRSVEYLKEHGKCVDSILPGRSTLESHQAGRGAFATRSMKSGTIITGSPLNHVPKELITIFNMERNLTAEENGEEVWLRHVDDIVGYQMELNYCYGHEDSTLLLCPYGAGVNYINHNQTRANVRVQWAQDGMTAHNSTWVDERRVEDLEWDYGIGLAFDYVATTDIEEGAELFLDYGDIFEDALNHHISTFNSSVSEVDYIAAQPYNKKILDTPIRTEVEQKEEPYPANLEMRCHSDLVTKQRSHGDDEPGSYWEYREFGVPCRILGRYVVDQSQQGAASMPPLNVTVNYMVELTVPLDEVGLQYRSDTFNYIQRKGVSRRAIQFFNRPYTTDLHRRNVFRKEIKIPDSMFPQQWRNRYAPKNANEEFLQVLRGTSRDYAFTV